MNRRGFLGAVGATFGALALPEAARVYSFPSRPEIWTAPWFAGVQLVEASGFVLATLPLKREPSADDDLQRYTLSDAHFDQTGTLDPVARLLDRSGRVIGETYVNWNSLSVTTGADLYATFDVRRPS
jgi:hypothetical protein